MPSEVKIPLGELVDGAHVRLLVAPGASICGKVRHRDDRLIILQPCTRWPNSVTLDLHWRDTLAAWRQLSYEACSPQPLA